MHEVGFKSMTSFSKDNITKQYNSQYSIIPEASFTSNNGFKMTNVDNKDVINLKKTVNRLEKNISLIQQEHSQMLKGLHIQMERLREENQELQFQLVMRSGRATSTSGDMPVKRETSEDENVPLSLDSESAYAQILKLKEAIEEEKAKNSELISKLNSLAVVKEEINSVAEDADKMSPRDMDTADGINISPNIRISFAPLTVSLFHEESAQFVANPAPSVQDCELVIRTLLEQRHLPFKRDSESSLPNVDIQRPNAAPFIKRPLHSMKPLSRNSAPHKLNPLHGTLSSRSMGLTSSHQKLSPIVSHQDDIMKLEEESYRVDMSRKSGREDRRGTSPPFSADAKTGCSLPALPRPADYNQADKQRRLHLLQRKRLDNYNNKL